jgi:hypothetical protein
MTQGANCSLCVTVTFRGQLPCEAFIAELRNTGQRLGAKVMHAVIASDPQRGFTATIDVLYERLRHQTRCSGESRQQAMDAALSCIRALHCALPKPAAREEPMPELSYGLLSTQAS